MTLSAHTRLALLDRFAPVEIVSEDTRPARLGSPEYRLHFDGHLDGHKVNILVRTGGVLTRPLVSAMAWDADGPGEARLVETVHGVIVRDAA